MRQLFLIPSAIEWQKLLEGETLEGSAAPGLPLQTAQFHGAIWASCGIGPAASALSTSLLIRALEPESVTLLGIGGAFQQSGLQLGDVVQASSECFADLGYEDGQGFHTFDTMGMPIFSWAGADIGCSFEVEPFHKDLISLPFATVSAVTNSSERADKLYQSFNVAVENMEGAGVALACQVHGVTFSQVRGISNIVGPRNPKAWRVDDALAAVKQAVLE
jgi:futalosine hydrolase